MISMDKNLKMPFRRFEIGRVFRNGPVKAGRLREFIQADVDVVGIDSIWVEVDFFLMVRDVFEELDLTVEIQYNDRALLYGIMALCKIPEELYNKVILILDKALKVKEKVLLSELKDIGISEEKGARVLELLRKDFSDLVKEIRLGAVDKQILGGIERFEELQSVVEELGLSNIMKLNIGLARGLEVYTGTIWEVFVMESGVKSSIAAGGRYDKLIASFVDNGREYPTVGMTFGLDVIYTVLKEKEHADEWQEIYFLIPFPGNELATVKLGDKLRTEGNCVVMEMKGMRIGKAMNLANKMKYQFVIIVGEDEVASGKYKVKDMMSGNEVELLFK